MPDMNTTGLDQAPTPHLGAWFKVMLLEVIKQAEWGHEVGQKLLAHEGNIWTDLQLLSSHAGSAAAFIDTLGSRKAALEKAFPGRGQTLRDVCDTSYDFAAVLESATRSRTSTSASSSDGSNSPGKTHQHPY